MNIQYRTRNIEYRRQYSCLRASVEIVSSTIVESIRALPQVQIDPFLCKTKPICRPSAGNPKFEVRNPKWGHLKKQSQFLKGQNGVKSMLTMVYGDFSESGLRKNKANSKPICNGRIQKTVAQAIPYGKYRRQNTGDSIMKILNKAGVGRYYVKSVCWCGSTASLGIYGFEE